MTKRDRKLLAKYIRQAADHMALRDWTFELKAEPAEPGCYAMVWPVYGQRHANIAFCENFRTLDPEVQRGTIIHELIHCHLAVLQSQMEDDLEGELSRQADAVFFKSVRRSLEFAVDGLERALSQHFSPSSAGLDRRALRTLSGLRPKAGTQGGAAVAGGGLRGTVAG